MGTFLGIEITGARIVGLAITWMTIWGGMELISFAQTLAVRLAM